MNSLIQKTVDKDFWLLQNKEKNYDILESYYSWENKNLLKNGENFYYFFTIYQNNNQKIQNKNPKIN